MSRKKLKGFDPGNNNKARRSAYQELQDGPASLFNQAPRAGSDSNRLSGAARRFATQVLISKKLDQRDRERERLKAAAEGAGGPTVSAAGSNKRKGASGSTTNFMPDYKQALQAQIAAAAEKSAKRLAKDERRRIAREHAAAQPQPEANNLSSDAADEFSSGAAAASAAVSLSKSVDQQRQQKADQARSAADKQKRRIEQEAQRQAASAAAASEAAASTAAASAASGPALLSDGAAPAAEKVVFTTEMRAGESFRSYQARLVREKAEKMQVEVKGKKMSEKKKRKLSERESKKKSKKDPNMDPREARFQAERDAKDAADEAARAARSGRKNAASAEDGDDSSVQVPPSKKPRTTATEFAVAESVGFGDIVERPPTLTVIPKSKTLPAKLETERILAGLLLLQEKKAAKKKGSAGGMDADEKAEWVAKQREMLRLKSATEAKAQSDLEALRAQSIAAYKASKLRAKAESASSEDAPKPYIKKSVLKKQKRNRERLQGFKDAQELDADMEIEMAGGFDD